MAPAAAASTSGTGCSRPCQASTPPRITALSLGRMGTTTSNAASTSTSRYARADRSASRSSVIISPPSSSGCPGSCSWSTRYGKQPPRGIGDSPESDSGPGGPQRSCPDRKHPRLQATWRLLVSRGWGQPHHRHVGSARGEIADGLPGVDAEGQQRQRRGGHAVVDVALDVLAAGL